jgi:hypothetical protein
MSGSFALHKFWWEIEEKVKDIEHRRKSEGE